MSTKANNAEEIARHYEARCARHIRRRARAMISKLSDMTDDTMTDEALLEYVELLGQGIITDAGCIASEAASGRALHWSRVLAERGAE